MKLSSSQETMTQGHPLQIMIRFALPMLVGGIFSLMYNMVDTIVLGRFVGVDALASIGVTGTVVFGLVQSAISIMNAVSVVVSQAYGAGNTQRLKQTVGNAVWLVLIVGVVIGGIGFFCAGPLMHLMGTPEDIIDGAILYIRIVCGLVIVQLVYNAVAAILRAIGDSRTPLIFLILCSVLNVMLDLFFVLILQMGIAGVAIATILSQAVSAILSVIYMLKKYETLRITRKHLHFDPQILRDIMRIGIPLFIQTVFLAAGESVITAVINTFGSDTVAAYTIGSRVEQIATVLFSQFAFSFAIFAGQNFGAHLYERIFDGVRKILMLILMLSAGSTLCMFLFGRPIAAFFMDAGTSSHILDETYTMIRVEASLYSALGAIWLYNSALRGVGDSRYTLYSSIVELISKIGLSILLSHFFGQIGIWFASPIGWVLGLAVSAGRFYSGRWQKAS